MREEIIALLISNMGKYISGQAMSETLGISRAAVWKHISKLKEEGCDIVSVNNRGHMLRSMPDSLQPGFFKAVPRQSSWPRRAAVTGRWWWRTGRPGGAGGAAAGFSRRRAGFG